MLRTYADQVSLWEVVLPEEVRRLSVELARVDRLLDDEVYFPRSSRFSIRGAAGRRRRWRRICG
jgi:hypothetical protein